MTNKIPTEDHIKEVEQDDRIIQFDNGEVVTQFDNDVASADVLRTAKRLIEERAKENPEEAKALIQSIGLPDLDEESKRSDRFFGMRLNGKSIDDIENKFLAMFAEFVSLMALFIGMLGFGVLLWAIFGG
jgi:predicted RNA-binding protein with PUA domain